MIRSPHARRAATPVAVAPLAALFAAVVSALVAPRAVRAAEFACEVPGDRRHLHLALPGEDHLCEVVVDRLDTGGRRVVWYADNDSSFCAERIEELAAKYESEWGFDCTRWPEASGVGALDPARRAALDAELLRRRAALAGGARLVGVRVDRAPGGAEAPLEATEFFVRERDGRVRTALALERGGRALARVEDLAAAIVPAEPAVRAVRLDGLGADGSVRLATELAVDGAECRGAQTLFLGEGGTLVPGTPHRFACDSAPLAEADAVR